MSKIYFIMSIILVACLTIGGVSAAWIYSSGTPDDAGSLLDLLITKPKYTYTVTYINNSEVLDSVEVEFGTPYSTENETAAQAAVAQMGSGYEFSHWINAGSTRVDSIPADNTEDIVLYPSFVGVYTAIFVDQNGNIVHWTTFTEGQKALDPADIPPVPEIEDAGIIRFTGKWEEYTLNNADITIYPIYEIATDNLGFTLTPADHDADGDTDYYIMEVTSNVGADITVPGYVNGCPILIVKNLTSGSDAKDVVNIEILEGVEELSASASTGAAKLQTIALPHSLKRITGDNIFGNGNKQIAITYAGTVEEFCQIQKINGWDNGLGNGTTITCTDGVINCNGKGEWIYNSNTININPNPYTP